MKLFLFILIFELVNCSSKEIRVVTICEWKEERIDQIRDNKNNKKLNSFERSIIDVDLVQPKPLEKNKKLFKLQEMINKYSETLNEMSTTDIFSEDIIKLKDILMDRLDSINLLIASIYEKQGDKFYKEYDFTKSLEAYLDSRETIRELYNEKVQKNQLDKLYKKIKLTRETGENFLNNKIKNYIDQAIFLNLSDQSDLAIDAMNAAERELFTSVFLTDRSIVDYYNEQARVMKLNKFRDGSCKSILNKKIQDPFKKQLKIRITQPESYRTKTGIKFTKILRKDGKPVYVSDRIRPNEEDSWYYARDYAKRLNYEEDCSDCYSLPELEDIVNLKTNGLEGIWLKNWSLAPFGLIFGNIFFGVYTFDFLHDIFTHPFTWQSYIYPSSPDSVSSRGGTWTFDARFLRSAYGEKGFRLVRPIQ